MPSFSATRRHPAAVLLTLTLLVNALPMAAVAAREAPRPTATPATVPRPHASPRRTGTHGPSPRVTLTAQDRANARVSYRLLGDLVQWSTNAGQRWRGVLTTGGHPRRPVGDCQPARYQTVTGLDVTGLLPGSLLVTTGGIAGRAAASRRQFGCTTATGGLYALRPDGHGHLRRTDSLAAGLPYAQDPHGKTPRAYALYNLAVDPTSPNILYADAAIPGGKPGRGSPPAGLYRSSNGGFYWNPIMAGLPPYQGSGGRDVITPNPAHPAIVFDHIGKSLYRSTDHGTHWSLIRGITATASLRLFVNPADPLLVYVLTDRGIFHSHDAGATWARLSNRQIPAPRGIATLQFDPRSPGTLLVVRGRGWALRLREPHAPAPPTFDLGLALTPLVFNRVVLALHAAPRSSARLTVVGGANRTNGHLTTGDDGFGYTTVALSGRVVPRALRVRVQIGKRSAVLAPWLPPGYVPGSPPPPPATPTPTATNTFTPSPTATATLTPTATATPSPSPTLQPSSTVIPIPTPYPASPLTALWTWKQLTPVLPPCPPPTTPLTATATGTTLPTLTATATWTPSPTATSPAAVTPGPSSTPTPSPTLTPSPTGTPTATATSTAVPPCDAGPPLARQDYAAAWDNADHRLFIFGGTDTKTAAAYGDISSYSTITGAWSIITPPPPLPLGRRGASAVWDAAHNQVVIFGGMVGAGPFAHFDNDVWAYAPATNSWTALSPNGAPGAPSPRAHAATTWDAASNRLIVFGGQTNDNATPALANDLWAFDVVARTWTPLTAASGSQALPPQRQWAQIAWDPTAGVLRLFGGKNAGSGAMSDTWTWAPVAGWSYENVPDQPPGRGAAGYAWDETHARFVVGPGVSLQGNSTDVWQYDPPSHDWLQVPVAASPALPARQMAQMVWDAADNQALLFGGRQSGAGASNDLWALIPTGQPAPAPTAAPPPGQVLKGVDIGQVVNGGNNHLMLTAARVQQIAATGAAYARFSFYIGDGQTSWTAARLHAYEQVITLLSQRGIGVLPVASSGITGGWSPANWTQNAQETSGGNGFNPAIQDYVNQLKTLVAHFQAPPYNVTRWEIWNEPNVPLAGCATFTLACLQQPSLQPSNFAAVLASAYQAVKGDPATRGVQLISGGIFGHSIAGSYSAGASGADYLAHTYAEGIGPTGLWNNVKSAFGSYPLDAVGEHLYVDQGQRTTPAVVRTYLDWFHAAYAAYEGTGKSTIVTEAGWRTGDPNEPQVSPDIQASNLETTFDVARRAGYVRELCWFQLQDDPGYLHNTSWGLLDRGGNPKPAYASFQKQ